MIPNHRRMLCASALACFALSSLTSAALAEGEEAWPAATYHWRGSARPVVTATQEVGEPVAAALARWQPWASAHGYRLDLDDSGVALLLTKEGDRHLERDRELVRTTVERFDALMPAPERPPETLEVLEVSWGAPQPAPERDPVVLVRLDEQDDYGSVLDQLAQASPYLGGFVGSARGAPGFVASTEQASGFLDEPAGIEIGTVWRSQNELVHRTTQLLLHRRFGPQAHWFETALAWNFEQAVVGDIYSFPHRNEFIGIGEHEGWKNELKAAFKKRKKDPLRFEEFLQWESGTWDMPRAQVAWGVVRYLEKFQPEALPAFAESHRLRQREGSVITHEDGSWELVPGFEVTPEEQAAFLALHAGEDFNAEATEYFRRWKEPKQKQKTKRQ